MALPTLKTYSVAVGQPINGGRWPGGRLLGDVELGAVAPGGALGQVTGLTGGVQLADVAPAGALFQAPYAVNSNAIWTWFGQPIALRVGDVTFAGGVSSAGTISADIIDHASGNAVSTVQLSSTALEADDHDQPQFCVLPSGNIVATYGKHNDDASRIRRCTNPSDPGNPASWAAEAWVGSVSQGMFSYPSPFVFPADNSKLYVIARRWVLGSSTTRALSFRSATSYDSASPTWTLSTDLYKVANRIPYWKLKQSGSALHVAITDMHPVEGQSSLFYFKLVHNGSSLEARKADGTLIGAAFPITSTDCDLVADGTTTRVWVLDVTEGTDGHPRILYTRYPGNDGSAIEYWHARWTGSAWTLTKIADDGAGLYSPEVYYPGGGCFNSTNHLRVCLSLPVSGVRQIVEYETSDESTWTVRRQITSGGTVGNPLRMRPHSPINHDGRAAYLYAEASLYASYVSFLAASKAVAG